MQVPKSTEPSSNSPENPRSPNSTAATPPPSSTVTVSQSSTETSENSIHESILDVSGKSLEFDLLGKPVDESVESLYLYKNEFSLVPRSVGRLRILKTLKFFGNEVSLFPAEAFGNLVGLECLQVKVSSSLGINGLGLGKLKGLKELDLSRGPPRPSGLTILSEVSGLRCLTKLSVCHFSIRYLPPEIGCLKNLEYLDLSFNKLKSLPTEISHLNSLISLKVANNKLLEVPSCLSLLQRLESLDLSNNRLASLDSLELGLMDNLHYLNLQYNKLVRCCTIPSWICCNLEGNPEDLLNYDPLSSSVEMDVYENSVPECHMHSSFEGNHHAKSNQLIGASPNSRNFVGRRSSKRWKRRHYLQHRARQERLNNSRKWKGEGCAELLDIGENENSKQENHDVLTPEMREDDTLDIGLDDIGDKIALSGETEAKNDLVGIDDGKVGQRKGFRVENSSCKIDSSKGREDECCVQDESLALKANKIGGQDESSCSETSKITDTALCSEPSKITDESSSSETSKITCKSKRHSDGNLDNPKPCKCQRPTEESSILSRKYSQLSYCSADDYLPDGFYDAGRDRQFQPLRSYEQIPFLDAREVILLDREKDEELDAIILSAQALVSRLKGFDCFTRQGVKVAVDDLQIASWLALFVSDHFGGSDRSLAVERTRKAVSGLNYRKPFVCTCSTGNGDSMNASCNQTSNGVEHAMFTDLCERSLQSIKSRQNSIVVPLGTLQFGVCRHRALLMKYLCDRMEPPIPCELVRGYLDFFPHAWNTILIKRGDSFVRMVVDACCPHDIREETDPEYFCRYIPLNRTKVPLRAEDCPDVFPAFSTSDEIEKAASRAIVRCKFGSVEAAAKVRNLEVCGNLVDKVRNLEYNFLGEVRILGALQHPCIVEMYGHQISSQWVFSEDGGPDRRVIQSSIFMEYVKGGSLKGYIEKLSRAGKKHVPMELAFYIACDVAWALVELHSKHIIHRDIKSENILIDLECKRADGMPVVKLCDFDRAVPLRSSVHTCCIAHRGIPPPNVCVGTPRWMAPEVLQAMNETKPYGLEVDIWSYGCLLLELLTLQIPYSAVPELHIHELLESGKRPRLTDELEALALVNEPSVFQSGSVLKDSEDESLRLRFLVNLFHRCTEQNPGDRPRAADIYESLMAQTSSFRISRSPEEVESGLRHI